MGDVTQPICIVMLDLSMVLYSLFFPSCYPFPFFYYPCCLILVLYRHLPTQCPLIQLKHTKTRIVNAHCQLLLPQVTITTTTTNNNSDPTCHLRSNIPRVFFPDSLQTHSRMGISIQNLLHLIIMNNNINSVLKRWFHHPVWTRSQIQSTRPGNDIHPWSVRVDLQQKLQPLLMMLCIRR